MSSATESAVTVKFDPNATSLQADIIGPATTSTAGVMTSAQVDQLDTATVDNAAALALTAEVIVVDSTNGSDSNPGTAAAPLATFDAAIAAAAAQNKNLAEIFLKAGNYTWTNKNIFLSKAVGNTATPLAIVGELSDELGTCTVAGGSTTTVVNFTPTTAIRTGATASFAAGAAAGNIRITGLTGMVATDVDRVLLISGGASAANNGPFTIAQVNSATSVDVVNAQGVTGDVNNGAIGWQESFQGCFLQFAANTATVALRGQARQIRAQGSTSQVTVATVFNAAPSAGDTFVIQRPLSVIQYGVSTDAANVVYVFDSGTLGLQGLKFKRVAGLGAIVVRLVQTQLESVWFQNGAVVLFNYAVMACGQGAAVLQWINQAAISPFSATRTGCGCFFQDVTGGIALQNHCRIVGVVIAINTVVTAIQDAVFSPTIWGDRVSVTITGGEMVCTAGGISKQQVASATTGIITMQVMGSLTLTAFDLSNSAGYGVDLQNASQGRFGSLTGTGNTATGGRVDRRSGATIDSPSGSTTITGTAGDWTFGHATVPIIQTYATIRTADGAGVKGYADSYLDRVDA